MIKAWCLFNFSTTVKVNTSEVRGSVLGWYGMYRGKGVCDYMSYVSSQGHIRLLYIYLPYQS